MSTIQVTKEKEKKEEPFGIVISTAKVGEPVKIKLNPSFNTSYLWSNKSKPQLKAMEINGLDKPVYINISEGREATPDEVTEHLSISNEPFYMPSTSINWSFDTSIGSGLMSAAMFSSPKYNTSYYISLLEGCATSDIKISELLRRTKVKQTAGKLANSVDGETHYCAVGAIMHELFGWDGDYSQAEKLGPDLNKLVPDTICNAIIKMNDNNNWSFNQIADVLEKAGL